jgi:integrase
MKGINVWRTAAGIEDGKLLRSITKDGKIGESLSDWVIWSVVEQSAKMIGIERLGAHDLRRTCAKALPEGRRRSRADQVSARTLVDPDHRAVSGIGPRDTDRRE